MNLDFDYRRYLDTLAADGMNYTRVFSGAYVEPEGAFKIARNTLAPAAGRFIAPWARSTQPGYANGGNKFDLTRWDDAYFARLKDFIAYAASKNVIVELTLFCPMYEDMQWKLSPMNAANNVNGVGTVARTDVYTLDRHGGLLAVQESLTRKLVTELNGFANLFFEICNEPYFGGVTLAWQHRIADVIVDTERGLPVKHLIAQNIANKSARIENPHPAVSIFNFHYATPPDTVGINYGLNRVIGDDETGFRGVADEPYRTEAWDFILAGGGLYNNLDYSFAAGEEDGTFAYPASQPGGGSRALRRQLKILSDFINGFDFIRMSPDNAVIKGGVPAGSRRARWSSVAARSPSTCAELAAIRSVRRSCRSISRTERGRANGSTRSWERSFDRLGWTAAAFAPWRRPPSRRISRYGCADNSRDPSSENSTPQKIRVALRAARRHDVTKFTKDLLKTSTSCRRAVVPSCSAAAPSSAGFWRCSEFSSHG